MFEEDLLKWYEYKKRLDMGRMIEHSTFDLSHMIGN